LETDLDPLNLIALVFFLYALIMYEASLMLICDFAMWGVIWDLRVTLSNSSPDDASINIGILVGF
jgi:hypothetical protein